ncbi:putative deoR family transcriptional regulator [Listeria monocytogenes]|uniref:DeoR/GlpR family DNA-binding transcription regulator n=1 Tax=Listeria monocytogenes TaxID=1639 RepID=UPI000A1D58A0|nr:DeoR/GlpR family DNA-binding transcription regulator [Listeria monocytogenes]ARM72394.1 putative deoR family transcriptional regulator [Listeria monocytogenes]
MGKVELRRKRIIEILNEHSIISLANLADSLHVTTETIRNDLKSPDLSGKVVQAHGSVAIAHSTIARDVPYSFRKEINSGSKSKLANQACEFVSHGQVIVIEHNSVSVMLIHMLSQYPQLLNNITVITNSFSIMHYVQEKNLDVHIVFLGGIFSLRQENSYGSMTVQQMKGLKADISFISPGAMNEELEITAYKEQDADLQKEIINNTQKNILLIEKSKYPSIAMWKVNQAFDYDVIITELEFTKQQLETLNKANVTIISI